MMRCTGAASAPPSGCKLTSPCPDMPRKRAGRARARSAAAVRQLPMDAAAATVEDAGTCVTAEDGTFDEAAWAAAAAAAGCFYSGVAHDAAAEAAGASPVLWTAQGNGSVENPFVFLPGFAPFFGAMPALFCDASDMPMLPLGMSPDGMVCDPEDQLDAFYRALNEDKNVVYGAFLEALSLFEGPVGGPGEEPVASDSDICTALLDALTEQMSVCSKRRHRWECDSLPEKECTELRATDAIEEAEADLADDNSAQRELDHNSGECAQETQEDEGLVAQEQSAQHAQQDVWQDSGRTSRHEGYADEHKGDGSAKRNRPGQLPTHSTAMLRNIPSKYTREMLLQQLNNKFHGQFNFLYLPTEFKNKCNVGLKSRKVVEVTSARVHGLSENISRLRGSPVMHNLRQHPECMPLLFNEDGSVNPFPATDLPSVTQMRAHRRQAKQRQRWLRSKPGACVKYCGCFNVQALQS